MTALLRCTNLGHAGSGFRGLRRAGSLYSRCILQRRCGCSEGERDFRANRSWRRRQAPPHPARSPRAPIAMPILRRVRPLPRGERWRSSPPCSLFCEPRRCVNAMALFGKPKGASLPLLRRPLLAPSDVAGRGAERPAHHRREGARAAIAASPRHLRDARAFGDERARLGEAKPVAPGREAQARLGREFARQRARARSRLLRQGLEGQARGRVGDRSSQALFRRLPRGIGTPSGVRLRRASSSCIRRKMRPPRPFSS